MHKLWSPQDVADYLDLPVGTIYQWRTQGKGPTGKRVGKHVRYRPEDVHAWYDALPEGVI